MIVSSEMDFLSCFDRFIPTYLEEVKKNSQVVFNTSTANIGEIRPARNQSCLPPPPDYYGPQPLDFSIPKTLNLNYCYNVNNNSNLRHQIIQTPNNSASFIDARHINKSSYKKFLINWSVAVLEIPLKNDNTKLIIELRGK